MKMKNILITFVLLAISHTSFAQKMLTRTGEVKFEASMPAFEEVAATSKTASCILDKATGDFVALTLIKSFKFKAPLMEEHFNENYMESSKFPKATFKGKILNFDGAKLSTTKTSYDLEGDLTIHGVTKKFKTKINLATNGAKIAATSNITVKPQDYKIEIPSLVKSKIADKVNVAMNFILESK
jgi:polyisoprenoid-binding protein YceI